MGTTSDRTDPLLQGDEYDTVVGFLDYQRATFRWKCGGLDTRQLQQSLPPSGLTLAGLMKHLTYVEDEWFGHYLLGEPRRDPWDAIDWNETPEWDWTSAAADEADSLRREWERAVDEARSTATKVYASGGLASVARRPRPNGDEPSLRWILLHMIEEYARHNGHADLVREAIDGATGE